MLRPKNITVIGGGTGTYTILTGLKNIKNSQISAIVSMADNGGSNRIIRDEFGLLPTSDLRQCMVALATDEADEILRKLFTYRFESGTGISGMTFGNLFMAALTDINGGNQKKAIEETCKILGVKGKILPVTYDKTNLVATYTNGKQILGEHEIDEPDKIQGMFKITKLELIPQVKANPEAISQIKRSDVIVLGPGDLYTSVLPNIVIPEIAKAIKNSGAKIVYVLNIMTKFGQTINFQASDFVLEIRKYLGKYPDYVVVSKIKKIPQKVIDLYKDENAELVKDNLNAVKEIESEVIRANLISDKYYNQVKSDSIQRSLIRHDGNKLAKIIVKI